MSWQAVDMWSRQMRSERITCTFGSFLITTGSATKIRSLETFRPSQGSELREAGSFVSRRSRVSASRHPALQYLLQFLSTLKHASFHRARGDACLSRCLFCG